MKCPDCETDLKAKMIGVIEVDRCDRCGGTWFDEGEFGQVRTTIRPRDVELTFTPTGFPAGRCPRCGDVVLSSGLVAPTPVGRCSRCRGIWVSNPIRTAEERKVISESVTGILEIVLAVLQFFP
jgi:Zn-finger nucleic acid-binding protein